MRWRDCISDPPKVVDHYFVYHPRYGKCVYGWKAGWGWDDEPHVAKPTRWLDESN